MTTREFDLMRWGVGEHIIYKGVEYEVQSIDYEERLIAFYDGVEDDDEVLTWVRCESCKLIDKGL